MATPQEFIITSDYRGHNEEGLDELALSIQQNGLYNPITVVPYTGQEEGVKFEIVAGRRRFKAMTQYLHWKQLRKNDHFIIRENVDALIAQFQENFERKDFSPVELGQLIKAIHEKQVQKHGMAMKGKTGGWGLKDTGKIIGRDSAFISRMISIAENAEKVKDCENISEALDTINKEKSKSLQSKVRQARVEKKLGESPPELEDLISQVYNDKAENFLHETSDEIFDLILTDPPYAINYQDITEDERTYEDDPDQVRSLLEQVIPQYYRVLKEDKYCVVWTAYEWFSWLSEIMEEVGFKVARTPITWVKLNSSGKSMSPNKTLGSLTEIAVYGWKGDAELTFPGKGNAFPVSIVHQNRIHVTQKPDLLLSQILEIFSWKNDLVLDTFGGSLSLLRACFNSGRKSVICEKDKNFLDEAINYTRDLYKEEK